MSWKNKDHAPIGNTCPHIDEAQWHMDDFASDLESVAKRIREYGKELEKLRHENATLREWGNDECKRANEYESEADELRKQLETANDEIQSLIQEVKDYEKQINQLT